MRKITFRGKRTDNGEWVSSGNLLHFNENNEYYIPAINGKCVCTHDDSDNIIACNETLFCKVIPETVGQYTGLTDKNGNKIFEGDIIQFDYKGENLGVNGKASVVFQNGKFGVLWGWHKEFVCLDGFANTTLEIIGNIHDNPELLKGGAE